MNKFSSARSVAFVLTLTALIAAVFSVTASRSFAQTVQPGDTSRRLSFESEIDKKTGQTRQTLTFRKPGSKPLVIEHGLDLPTFTNPNEYASDVAHFQRDAYTLKMVSIGAETEVIKEIPSNLKGDKLREWLRSQATIVENSICSNPAVKTEIMEFFRNAIKVPPAAPPGYRGQPIDPSKKRKKSPTMV